MATSKSVDSLGDLTALMQEFSNSNKTRQLEDLKKSIENLSKILENKVGVNKKQKEDDGPRTLTKDIKDFFQQPYKDVKSYFGFGEDKKARTLKKDSKELVEEPYKEAKTYFGIKNKMPDNLELKQEEATAKPQDNLELKQEEASGKKGEEITGESIRNRVSEMKVTPFQKKILDEVVKIKSLLTKSKSETPLQANMSASGIEPNSDEDKQRDRELLAQAIADKLNDLGTASGIGGLGIPGRAKPPIPVPAGKVPPGGKVPPVGKVPGKIGMLGVGGRLLSGAGLAVGAYEASEFLDETGYGDQMAEGAGKNAEKAFRENVAPTIDPVKTGMTPEEARNALGGSDRDIEKLGGREALLKIATTDFQSSGSSKDLKEEVRIKEQSLKTSGPMLNKEYRDKLQTDIDTLNKRIPTADMPDQTAAETARLMRSTPKTEAPVDASVSPTGYKYEPISYEAEKKYGSPTIDPIQTGDQKINYLKQIEDQYKELTDASSKLSSQIITPMISNNNIDNSRQTIMPAQPNPYTNGKGFNSWQSRVDSKL